MIYIEEILADEVLDSRGNPTVRATVRLSDGTVADAIVPSGASTGKREALELRDGDPQRFLGKGVLNACENVNNQIAEALVGISPFNQAEVDLIMKELDGTQNYSNLGANAVFLGRDIIRAAVGAGALGVKLHLEHIRNTLKKAMFMTGTKNIEMADSRIIFNK